MIVAHRYSVEDLTQMVEDARAREEVTSAHVVKLDPTLVTVCKADKDTGMRYVKYTKPAPPPVVGAMPVLTSLSFVGLELTPLFQPGCLQYSLVVPAQRQFVKVCVRCAADCARVFVGREEVEVWGETDVAIGRCRQLVISAQSKTHKLLYEIEIVRET